MKKFNIEDKYIKYILVATLSICFIILFENIISNFGEFTTGVSSFFALILTILQPVIIGFCLAFFLYKPVDILTCFFYKKKIIKKHRPSRVIATVFMMIITLIIFALFIYIVIPSVSDSIASLIQNFQDYIITTQNLISDIEDSSLLYDIFLFFGVDISNPQYIDGMILDIFSYTQSWLEQIGAYLLNFAIGAGSLLVNFLLGFFFSIYMLIEKEQLISQVQRFSKVVLKEKYIKVSTVCSLLNYMFFKFLSGKGLCSVIVGIICYILCVIFKIEYAALIGVIIAVTNMVPMFGPYVGAVPAILFAFITGGITDAFIMLVIIIVVQQIDVNILAPNILGEVVGLNGFWVMFSIIFCGSLWGILGMILAIPVFGVLRILVGEWLYIKEEKKSDKPII